MKLKNIKIKDFHNLNFIEYRQYITIGRSLRPHNENLPDVMKWSFGAVKEIQRLFRENVDIDIMIEIVETATGRDVKELPWYDVFAIFNHIEKEITRIFEIEKQLEADPGSDQIEAGIERYHAFDYFATLDRLCGSGVFTGMNYKQVMEVDYETVFIKMKLNKLDMEYTENYSKIIQRKTKY